MEEKEEIDCCLICCEPIGIGRLRCVTSCGCPCSPCSTCFLRMRTLAGAFDCPSCKQRLEDIVCVTESSLTYEVAIQQPDIFDQRKYTRDLKARMYIPLSHYQTTVEPLISHRCSLCNEVKRSYTSLNHHYQSIHSLFMCQLCVDNKQCFPPEQKVYNTAELREHERNGEPYEGSQGHPVCEFCQKRFYDKTVLFYHLSKEHYTCFICDQQGIMFTYYEDYAHLEEHFRNEHFLCTSPYCLVRRFTVFAEESELDAHRIERHQNESSTIIPVSIKRKGKGKSSNANSSLREAGTFEGGLGGRVSSGSWRVEMDDTARHQPSHHRSALSENNPSSLADAALAAASSHFLTGVRRHASDWESAVEYPPLGGQSMTRLQGASPRGCALTPTSFMYPALSTGPTAASAPAQMKEEFPRLGSGGSGSFPQAGYGSASASAGASGTFSNVSMLSTRHLKPHPHPTPNPSVQWTGALRAVGIGGTSNNPRPAAGIGKGAGTGAGVKTSGASLAVASNHRSRGPNSGPGSGPETSVRRVVSSGDVHVAYPAPSPLPEDVPIYGIQNAALTSTSNSLGDGVLNNIRMNMNKRNNMKARGEGETPSENNEDMRENNAPTPTTTTTTTAAAAAAAPTAVSRVWSCEICTFVHDEPSQQEFACCAVCGGARYQSEEEAALVAVVESGEMDLDHLRQRCADEDNHAGGSDEYELSHEFLRDADVPRPIGWPVQDVTHYDDFLLRRVVSVLLGEPGYCLRITEFGLRNKPGLHELGNAIRTNCSEFNTTRKLTSFFQRFPGVLVCFDLDRGGPKLALHPDSQALEFRAYAVSAGDIYRPPKAVHGPWDVELVMEAIQMLGLRAASDLVRLCDMSAQLRQFVVDKYGVDGLVSPPPPSVEHISRLLKESGCCRLSGCGDGSGDVYVMLDDVMLDDVNAPESVDVGGGYGGGDIGEGDWGNEYYLGSADSGADTGVGGDGGVDDGSGMGRVAGAGLKRDTEGSSERSSTVEYIDHRPNRNHPPRIPARTGAGAMAGAAISASAATPVSALAATAPHRPRPRPVPTSRKSPTQAPADRIHATYPPAPTPHSPATPALTYFEQKAEELRIRVEEDIATHEAKDALRRVGKLPVREVFGSATVFGALTGDTVSGETVTDVEEDEGRAQGPAGGGYEYDDEIGDGQMKRTGEVDRVPCQNPACFNEGSLVCSACEAVYYCSSDCQKMHWPAHKVACAQMRSR